MTHETASLGRYAAEEQVSWLAQHSPDEITVKQGRLALRAKWELFWYRHGWRSGAENEAVEAVLKKIHNYCEGNINSFWVRRNDELIRKFYFHVVAKFDQNVFSRAQISKKMQNFLSSRLAWLRAEKDSLFFCDTPAHRVARKVAKAELAIRLGIRPKPSKEGVTGGLVYYGLKGKELGMFKPVSQERVMKLSKRRSIAEFFGFGSQTMFCRSKGRLPDFYSEVSAAYLDNFFKMGFIPATEVVEIDEQKGSFMVWIHNVKWPSTYRVPSEGVQEEELERFQIFAIMDYLIGNLDRHGKNWMYQDMARHLAKIVAIDNANSFLEENPENDTFSQRLKSWTNKQYQWRQFPLADRLFTPKTKDWLCALTPEKIDQLIEYLRERFPESPERDAFFSEAMVARLKERAAVLRKAARKVNFSPKNLAALFTGAAIKSFLSV